MAMRYIRELPSSIARGGAWSILAAVATAAVVLLAFSESRAAAVGAERVHGWQAPLGKGSIASYADLQDNGVPRTLGIAIDAAALSSLPVASTDGHHCFDRNGDGVASPATECAHTHELVVPLPDAVTRRDDVPLKWVLFNWNKHGHMPPGIYDVAHFDVHFYMVPIQDVFAIHDGPCGPEMVDCAHYDIAKQPLADGLMHPDFKDVDAVAPAMGNHLVDVSGDEFNGQPFTSSWIYGSYGGRVTFFEQMIALDFLKTRPNMCAGIKQTPEVAVSGHYPTQRCIRYDRDSDTYLVSLENFVYRAAR
ncbi:MAG: hypothetical protein U0821_23275 [Chloroflexota bacterium]